MDQFTTVKTHCVDDAEIKILTGCYNHDDNAIPPCYRLKKLDQIKNWTNNEGKLRSILSRVSEVEKKLISMTEQEVQYAIELDQSRVIVITKKNTPNGRKRYESDEDESHRIKQAAFVQRVITQVQTNNLLVLDQELKDDFVKGLRNYFF